MPTDEHAAEAAARWGTTEAFRESRRRAAGYTASDWERIKAEADDIEAQFALALRSGRRSDDPAVLSLAEQHRQHLRHWFYACDADMHRGLAELYVTDERFTAHYDVIAAGLASYVAAAIRANADALG